MKKSHKILFNTLLAATLSGGILSACTKTETNDAEKNELQSATETQKKMSAEARSRQEELNNLISENQALQTELAAEREDLDARIQTHSQQREMRERQMMALTMTISNYQVQLEELKQAHAAATAELQAEEAKLAQRQSEIQSTLASLNAEKTELQGQISEENSLLVELQTRISSAEADLETTINSILEEARVQAQNLITSAQQTQMESEAEAAKLQEEARTEAAAIIAAAEASAESTREEAQAAIAADRQAFEDEVNSRETALTAEESTLIERAAELNTQLQKLETDQTQLAQDLSILAQQQSELATAENLLASNQATLARDTEEFSAQVAATRDLFTSQGEGDVFDNIRANETYTFRMSLWGYGSVENILKVRKRIKQYNDSNNQAGNNANIEYSPRLIPHHEELAGQKLEDLSEAEIESLQAASIETFGDLATYAMEGLASYTAESITGIDFQVVRDIKEKVVTRDSYMITGTATEVKAFRDDLNQLLSEIASGPEGVQSANMWVSAQPVSNVRVNMKIKLIGSTDTSYNRDQKTIAVFSKIRPVDAGVKELVDIEINNPAQYVFSNPNNQSICEQVNLACLQAIKDANLLNHSTTFGYQDSNGNSQSQTLSYSEILEQILKSSIQKLKLQRVISRLEGEGFLVQLRVRPVSDWSFMEGSHTDWEYDETELEEQVADMEANRNLLEALNSQPVLEKIEIDYEVVMVDVIDGNSAALNLGEYLQAGRLRGSDIRSGELTERGEIEVPLPYTTIEKSTSQFVDLTLENFNSQMQAPVSPISETDLEKLGRVVMNDLLQNFDRADRDVEEMKDSFSYKRQREMLQFDDSVVAAFDRASEVMPAYVEYLEAKEHYEKTIRTEKDRAYMHRSEELIGQLSFLKSDLFGNDDDN